MSRGRGPRPQDPTDRGDAQTRRRLGAGFVLLVGISGGTMALQGGAEPAVVGLSALAGLVAGGALLWYLVWIVS